MGAIGEFLLIAGVVGFICLFAAWFAGIIIDMKILQETVEKEWRNYH